MIFKFVQMKYLDLHQRQTLGAHYSCTLLLKFIFHFAHDSLYIINLYTELSNPRISKNYYTVHACDIECSDD